MRYLRTTDKDGMVWLSEYREDRVGDPGVEVVDDTPPPPPPIAASALHPVAQFRQTPATVTEIPADDSVTVTDDVHIKMKRPKRYKAKGWKE